MTSPDVFSADFWRDDVTAAELGDFGIIQAGDPAFVPAKDLTLEAIRKVVGAKPENTAQSAE